jgi:hypothetical protein
VLANDWFHKMSSPKTAYFFCYYPKLQIMDTDKDKSATGNKQSGYAGTNPNRYGQPEDNQDNPIVDGEAQNVTDGAERLSGEEAERARNKATEGQNQGRNDQQ